MKILLSTFMFALAVPCLAQSIGENTKNFDLDRYMGLWYEIARYPNPFEKGLEYITAEYTKTEGKKYIRIINSGYKTSKQKRTEAKGRMKTTSSPRTVKVSFFPFVWSALTVEYCDSNYTHAIAISESGKYLWILSRTPTLSTEEHAALLDIIKKKGYSVDKLIYPEQ